MKKQNNWNWKRKEKQTLKMDVDNENFYGEQKKFLGNFALNKIIIGCMNVCAIICMYGIESGDCIVQLNMCVVEKEE